MEELLIGVKTPIHLSKAGEDTIEDVVEEKGRKDEALPNSIASRDQHIYQRHWMRDPIPDAEGSESEHI